jgi:hypothetical protein
MHKFDNAPANVKDFVFYSLCICSLITPVWYGIRECVGELKKIRELLDKKSE